MAVKAILASGGIQEPNAVLGRGVDLLLIRGKGHRRVRTLDLRLPAPQRLPDYDRFRLLGAVFHRDLDGFLQPVRPFVALEVVVLVGVHGRVRLEVDEATLVEEGPRLEHHPVAQQEVALTSLDSDALLEVMGALQSAGLVVTSQYYSLSAQRYEEVAAELMQDALAKLQSRANEAAAGLGKGKAELIEVSLDGSPNFAFRERGTLMAMDAAAMAPPVAVPGETQVSMTVSARALLSP